MVASKKIRAGVRGMCLFFGPKCACFEQLPYPFQSFQTLQTDLNHYSQIPLYGHPLNTRATHYYGKFALLLAKESSYIFCTSTRLTRTLP